MVVVVVVLPSRGVREQRGKGLDPVHPGGVFSIVPYSASASATRAWWVNEMMLFFVSRGDCHVEDAWSMPPSIFSGPKP